MRRRSEMNLTEPGSGALEIGCVLNRIKKAGRDYILTTICGEMDNHQFLGTERWRIQNNKLTTFTLGDSIDLDEPRPSQSRKRQRRRHHARPKHRAIFQGLMP